MQKLPTFWLSMVLLGLMCSASFASAPNPDRSQLKIFLFPHPQCQSHSLIETAKEAFTTIANDLPGRKNYNELVLSFQRKQWSKLDALMELFESVFEDSPLREAVAFLRVQSLFDRIESLNSPQIGEAEKKLRETLLLYPKSTLVPVVQATVGVFWLRNGQYSKSLPFFLKAKEEYPFHSLSCLFQFGVAENHFLLNDTAVAMKSFQSVIQKCRNPRLVTGAKLRLIEMDRSTGMKDSEGKLIKLYDSESNIITRFYPEALYNLGEIKFQRGELNSARFFFVEYLRAKNKNSFCASYARKRIADIALKMKLPMVDAIQGYLEVGEQFPNTDIGKYSYIQAMLLDYSQKSKVEQERRTQVIDEKLALIKENKLRYLAALNKGLSVLESGGKGAIDYLIKIAKNRPDELKSGELSEFISSRIFQILKKESQEVLKLDLKKESLKDQDLFSPIEDVYVSWIKGTSYQKATEDLYADLIEARYFELLEKKKWVMAFELIEKWKQSALWSNNNQKSNLKSAMGEQVVKLLMDLKIEEANELYQSILENTVNLSNLWGPQFNPLLVAANLANNNLAEVEKWLNKKGNTREPAQSKNGLSLEAQDFLELKKIEGLMALKKFVESELLLKGIESKKHRDMALQLRADAMRFQKKYSLMIRFGLGAVKTLSTPENKKRLLSSLVVPVNEGKLWKESEALLKEAKLQKLEGKDLAPFLYLAGKSSAEQKNCKKAIAYYSEAIVAEPENLASKEAKFRLGKCYLKDKKKELAKKQWQEVADSNDPFWGPLAKSEINLIGGP